VAFLSHFTGISAEYQTTTQSYTWLLTPLHYRHTSAQYDNTQSPSAAWDTAQHVPSPTAYLPTGSSSRRTA